jgi:predicted hotdog family 3-hydroxylacyl-ACP dehydratase
VSDTSFPSIAALVPHSDAMVLLDRVLEHESGYTICGATADSAVHFVDCDGRVPCWVGLEYMAQCAAVHGGLADRGRSRAPRPGLLLGSRRLLLHADVLPLGEELRVTARHHMGHSGLVAFDCSIRTAADREILAEGRVNLYILEDWSELGETRS